MKDKSRESLDLGSSLDKKILTHLPVEIFTQLTHLKRVFFHEHQFTQLPSGLEKLTGLEKLCMGDNPHQIVDSFLSSFNYDNYPHLEEIRIDTMFLLKEDADRLKQIQKQRNIDIDFSKNLVVDTSRFLQGRFMSFLFERKAGEARKTGQPLSMIGLQVHQLRQFEKTGEARSIQDHFVDFLNDALMAKRSDLHPVFTWDSAAKHYVVFLNMPHAKAKEVLNALQQEFKAKPYEKNGDPIVLPFHAGIVEYRPGAHPTLDAMENGQGLFDAMREQVTRNMTQADKGGGDLIVGSEWTDNAGNKK